MIAKILWSFILLSTVYVAAIFLAPAQADEVGDLLGIRPFNDVLREVKKGGSQDIALPKTFDELNEGSGALQKLKQVKNAVETKVEQTRNVVETKVEQTRNVVKSVEKTANAIDELQKNVSELTSLSGTSASGSASASGAKVSASGSNAR